MTFQPPEDLIYLALPADLVEALQAWIDLQPEPKPTRAEALRSILRDNLIGVGLLPFHEDPEMAN